MRRPSADLSRLQLPSFAAWALWPETPRQRSERTRNGRSANCSTHGYPQRTDRQVSPLRRRRPPPIDKRLRPALGLVRLDQLTTEHLDDLYGTWASEGLTGASIRRYAAPLRTALGQARRWGWLESNPAELATIPRGKASADTITPTPDEFGALVRWLQVSTTQKW